MKKFFLKKEILNGVKVFERNLHEDVRGSFSKLYCPTELEKYFKLKSIKQINFSKSKKIGSIRGMHFQKKPFQENKLITCISGSAFDVAIDLRKNSNTFLKWYSINLTSKNNISILIPKGFAHGFQSLANNTQLIYIHDQQYEVEKESSVNPLDPAVNIKWPKPISNISKKDLNREYINNTFKGF